MVWTVSKVSKKWQVCLLALVLNVLITNKQTNAILLASKVEASAKLGIYSKIAFGHWNYIGVVSRLLIASPGCKLMETHYVH